MHFSDVYDIWVTRGQAPANHTVCLPDTHALLT